VPKPVLDSDNSGPIMAIQALEGLRKFVGMRGSPVMSLDPVNRAMIRHWCEVMGDRNPSYSAACDEALVVPPAMLRIWAMPGFGVSEDPDALRRDLFRAADSAGFTSIVATDTEQVYLNPLRLGDTVRSMLEIEAISEVKLTRLGEGIFITMRNELTNQYGAPVGTHTQKIFKFRPARSDGAAALASSTATRRDPPACAYARPMAEAEAGDRIPDLPVAITRSFIIASAIISRDFQDIHHDHEAAQRRGAADIFTNIICTGGLVSRCVTDWTGEMPVLEKVAFRLYGQNYPGDTLVLSGIVERKECLPTSTRFEISIRGHNERTTHVVGNVAFSVNN
jgi:acyl dehydratase